MPKCHERPHSYPSTIGLSTLPWQRDGQQSEMGTLTARMETHPQKLGDESLSR